MRADICDPEDAQGVELFSSALKQIGAVLSSTHESSLGVDLRHDGVGDDELLVFVDSWSIDVEGPENVVNRLLALIRP